MEGGRSRREGRGRDGLINGFECFLGCLVHPFVNLFTAEGVGGAPILETGADGFCLSLHVSLEISAPPPTDVFDHLQDLEFHVVLVPFQPPYEEVFYFLAGFVGY